MPGIVLQRFCHLAARRLPLHPAYTAACRNRTGKLPGIQERRLRSDASRIATFEGAGFPGNCLAVLTDSLQGSVERLVLLGSSYQQYVTLIYSAVVSIDY